MTIVVERSKIVRVYQNGSISYSPMYDVVVCDASYQIEDGILCVRGNQVSEELVWSEREMLPADSVKYTPDSFYEKTIGLFRKRKVQFLKSGWVRLKERTPVVLRFSHFAIVETESPQT